MTPILYTALALYAGVLALLAWVALDLYRLRRRP